MSAIIPPTTRDGVEITFVDEDFSPVHPGDRTMLLEELLTQVRTLWTFDYEPKIKALAAPAFLGRVLRLLQTRPPLRSETLS